jgi:cystathionine gamma-synthase
MAADDLLNHPAWQPGCLGQPLPNSTHAVSFALPRWSDVVGYEEKTPSVTEHIKTGYPRFVIHPLVTEMAQHLGNGKPWCLPFPSAGAAHQACDFVRRSGSQPAETVARSGWHGVRTNEEGYAALRAFWQHTGLIVSSREAEARLAGRTPDPDSGAIRQSLRSQFADLYGCEEHDVFLAPTGMAAQWAALQVLMERAPGLPTAQFGFPYVDTFKLQQKLGFGGVLLHDLEHIETELKAVASGRQLAGAFCEIPGNPLLGSTNLRRVTPILRELRVPLVVDDVVATPFNVDLGAYADMVVTSLTKFIVGNCEAMGGALICNPRSPYYRQLHALARARHEDLLWGGDARVLDRQARDFPRRMALHNRNGLILAERLRSHPAIERVWYPKWEFTEAYEAVRRPAGGYGALITFLPRDAERRSPAVFDRLEVSKGPSLGTVFTLACPFTLLAHYTELDWAEACGVSRHLIRISAGLEDPDLLWTRIERALA